MVNSLANVLCRLYIIAAVVGIVFVIAAIKSGEISTRYYGDSPPTLSVVVTIAYCYVMLVVIPSAMLAVVVRRWCDARSSATVDAV